MANLLLDGRKHGYPTCEDVASGEQGFLGIAFIVDELICCEHYSGMDYWIDLSPTWYLFCHDDNTCRTHKLPTTRPQWRWNGLERVSQSCRVVGAWLRRNAAASYLLHHQRDCRMCVQHEPLARINLRCSRDEAKVDISCECVLFDDQVHSCCAPLAPAG